MSERKTTPTTASVRTFIASIEDDGRRQDCATILGMMAKATRQKPVMWGTSIIGFGEYDYPGASGKSTRWFQVGLSPRKANLTLYLLGGNDPQLLARLGVRSSGGGCLYIKRLDGLDRSALQQLIDRSVKNLRVIMKSKMTPKSAVTRNATPPSPPSAPLSSRERPARRKRGVTTPTG